MNTPESWDGYMGLVPDDAPWENKVAARSLLHIAGYRAIKVAGEVQAPTLLMGAIHDSLVAIEDIRKMAALMPRATLLEYDCNHFAPYYPPLFDTFATEQANFLVKHLRPEPVHDD
jgi:pimeloyl-ACP methyl ester carboxylesterase